MKTKITLLLALLLAVAVGAKKGMSFRPFLFAVRVPAVEAVNAAFNGRAAIRAFVGCNCFCHVYYLFLSGALFFVPPLDTMYYITSYATCQCFF